MEELLLLLVCLLMSIIVLKKRRERHRRYGVRPINRKRDSMGMLNNFIKAAIKDDAEYFFKYTRMSPKVFMELLNLTKPYLEKKITTKHPISPIHRLIMTLHYLAEGCSMQEIAFTHFVGRSTVSKIIKETTEVIWNVLGPLMLKAPTTEDWKKIEEGFFKRWNMPNCIGAVDGKHVAIQCPKSSHTQFFNYKKHFSLVLMATCDSYYRFTLVDVGGAGSHTDGAIFQASGFGQALLKNNLDIPAPKNLPNTDVTLPHFMVADAAFPLHTNIMRPYPGNNLGEEKNIFNYRLSRARRTIENTFGILTQRWRVYRRTINAKLSTCENIVLSTVVLHNFLQKKEADIPVNQRRYCPTGFVDTINKDGSVTPGKWREIENQLRSVGRLGANNANRNVRENRDRLMNYFLSPEGAVPWQWNKVLEGSTPQSFNMTI